MKKGSQLNEAIEETLKGKEIKIPEGSNFSDKDGTVRTEIRIKWWENATEITYKHISVEPLDNLPETKIDLSLLKNNDYYTEVEKPVFLGHYWLKTHPMLQRYLLSLL